MQLLIQATRKIWVARFVSRRVWVELAAWATTRSALKGWRLELRPGGLRVRTPLVGAGWTLWLGASA
jgi:hypothetical protein